MLFDIDERWDAPIKIATNKRNDALWVLPFSKAHL